MEKTTAFIRNAYLRDSFEQAQPHFDAQLGAAFFSMAPTPRPCFNPTLLRELRSFQQSVEWQVRNDFTQKGTSDLKFAVLASCTPGVFNLGGDLNLFLDLILKQDRERLLEYAISCIDIIYQMSISMSVPIDTIALIQGSAQGGGLESALSCNVVIAERGCMLGFPEVLFNLFPGMGAYSLLRQRVNASTAEKIILSGKLSRAEEFYELGVVDMLADPGEGYSVLQEYIRHAMRRSNAHNLIRHTRRKYNTISYNELLDITTLWVDTALGLNEREIRTMSRLVHAQNRKMNSIEDKNQINDNQEQSTHT